MSWRTSCRPPAPTRSSPSSATPTSSAARGWPPDERHGVVDADLPQLRRPQPLHHRRQRAADPGQRQPGPDDHGGRRPRRRPADPPEDRPMSSPTVADYLLSPTARVGGGHGVRLPRRRHQRDPRRLRAGRQRAAVHPGPARGDGRLRGRRATPSSPAGSGSAWPPPVRARSTCSTACTTPSSTTSRSWRSSARPTAARWAAPTSRRSTCSRCSRTSPASTSQMVTVPEQLPNVLDRAIRIALAERHRPRSSSRPTCRSWTTRRPTHAFKHGALQPRASPGRRPSARRRRRTARRRPAQRRREGGDAGRPGRARRRAPRCEQVADLLGAGVAKALLGKDVLSDDLPYVTGSIGLLGTRPSYEMMRDCDTLLTVGSSFPYTQFLPEFGQARARADRRRRQA